jgi:predicted nucleic acid-binding protein
MRPVELIADTNVISYMFNESALGGAYEQLIGSRGVGISGYVIAELRAGSIIARWGERRLAEQLRFLAEFAHMPCTREMAEVCGAIRAMRSRVGRPIEWPDAWGAACAMWLDVPLVTHDRDLEGIVGLQVLTVHTEWRIGESDHASGGSGRLSTRPRVDRSWLSAKVSGEPAEVTH